MAYKHVSVDFWHTLGEPNPQYPALRNAALAQAYGTTPQAASGAYKALKDHWEREAVLTGVVPGRQQLHAALDNVFQQALPAASFDALLVRLRAAFAQHPPQLCARSLAALADLRRAGVTVSIGSNTNFIIRGDDLQRLLPSGLFNFQLWSDQLGYCKPHPRFYGRVLLLAGLANPTLRSEQQVLHVGDSSQCDVQGATGMGLSAQLCSAAMPAHTILAQCAA